jgi:hypothetical protein
MILFIKINFLFNKITVEIYTRIKLIERNQIKKISHKVSLIRNTIQNKYFLNEF